ncbi:hypothetical protein TNCV_653221 [Trichonephila clavipes]|nr:hypothetical protein TNCV_653221 [Trichonephila clavipes]
MGSDCEIFMLGSRKLLIGRANRSEEFHDLCDFWLQGQSQESKAERGSCALSNSFSAIAHLEVDVKDLNEDNVVDTAPGTEEEDSIPQAPVEDPCNIDMIDNEQESPDESPLAVDAEISEVVGKKLWARSSAESLKVFPEDANAHRKIQNFISVKKLKSHTYEMAGEKQLKTVIRGLPSDFDVDEIIQELGTHNITPEHVSVMRNRKQNKNMPLFW